MRKLFRLLRSYFCKHEWTEWQDQSFSDYETAWSWRECDQCGLSEIGRYQEYKAVRRGFNGVFS